MPIISKNMAINLFGQFGNVKVHCHIVPGLGPRKYNFAMSPDYKSVNFNPPSALLANTLTLQVHKNMGNV